MLKGIYESEKKQRVAAYCRVSTVKGEQESSYKTQVAYFKEVIAYHPNWDMVEIYADYGITGTSWKKKKRFQPNDRGLQRRKNRPGAGKVFESFCEKHIGFFKVYSYVEGKKYRGMV